MADVNQEIRNILELKAQAKGIKATTQAVSAQADEKMVELRKRIKGGETTRDGIGDFVIAHYGFLNESIEMVYRKLETRIEQYVGEFILVIVKEENFHGCAGFGYEPRDSDYVVDEFFYLGVLKDGSLILNPADEKCEIPTDNHIRSWDAWGECSELVEGNIPSHRFKNLGLNLNKPLKPRNPLARFQNEPDLMLEVMVGDAEVKAWFEKRPVKRSLIAFQKMAKLLGRPIVESPELAMELQKRRETVANRLIELVLERDQLKQKIARIFGAVKGGVYSPDGVGVTVCEDEDDARVISMGPKQKLKEVEGEIKRQLKIALELDMADAQLFSVEQLCKEYEVRAS